MIALSTTTLSWRTFKHWYLTTAEQTPKLTISYYAIIFLGFGQYFEQIQKQYKSSGTKSYGKLPIYAPD